MKRPPASWYRPRAVETLAICISEKIPSCIRAPPPEPETITSGRRWRVASSMARVSFSPTTEPMLPMMKLLSVTPKTMRMPRMNPWPTIAASLSPVSGLLGLHAFGIRAAVVEAERVGRLQVGDTTPRMCPCRGAG